MYPEKKQDQQYLNLPTISSFADVEPHPLPESNLLDVLVDTANDSSKDAKFFGGNTIIVVHQHLVESTASFVNCCIRLGAEPNKIFITGYNESTCPAVVQTIKNMGVTVFTGERAFIPGGYRTTLQSTMKKLWNTVHSYLKRHDEVDTMLIVSHGSHVYEKMPSILKISDKLKIAACERSDERMSDLAISTFPYPVVSVANSVGKNLIEPFIIAEAIVRKLDQFIKQSKDIDKDQVVGIIGNNIASRTIINYLLENEWKNILFYDDSRMNEVDKMSLHTVRLCKDLDSLISLSDVILSCSRRDISSEYDLIANTAGTTKKIISMIPGNSATELLLNILANKRVKLREPFGEVQYETPSKGMLLIPNNGVPLIFDRSPSYASFHYMELFEALMLLATMQAKLSAKIAPKLFGLQYVERYMLTPVGQSTVIQALKRRLSYLDTSSLMVDINLDAFDSADYIRTASTSRAVDQLAVLTRFYSTVEGFFVDLTEHMSKRLTDNQEKRVGVNVC